MAWIEKVGKLYYVRDDVDGHPICIRCGTDEALAKATLAKIKKVKAAKKALEAKMKFEDIYKEGK